MWVDTIYTSENCYTVTFFYCISTRMSELSIPRNQGGVYFAQLLGMCDQVSFVLGKTNALHAVFF